VAVKGKEHKGEETPFEMSLNQVCSVHEHRVYMYVIINLGGPVGELAQWACSFHGTNTYWCNAFVA